MLHPIGFWPRSIFIAACFFSWLAANCLARPQSAPLMGQWRAVSLPSKVIDVTTISNDFWVCGVNEMIAKSVDGGQTWQVKHQKADGEVLLHVAFIQDGLGYAAGSNGIMLWTKDGGETWSESHSGTSAVLQISFSDDKNGLRQNGSAVEITHDGGGTWASISAYQSIREIAEFKTVAAVAALDEKRAAVLFRAGPEGSHAIVSTADGGNSWTNTVIPNAQVWGLVAHNGEFWAFGYEVIEKDKPGGGYGVAMALHSTEGVKWVHGVRAPSEFSACRVQGCILWDGAIVGLYEDKPVFKAVPADGSLKPVWAFAKGTICSVGPRFECAEAMSLDAPPQKPQSRRPTTGSIDPFLFKSTFPVNGCLLCRLEPFLLKKNLLGQVPVAVNLPGGGQRQMSMPGIKSTLEVRFRVRLDGTVYEITVKHAPNKEIESAVKEDIQNWVLNPPRSNAAFGGEGRQTKVEVSCMAFPSNEEATCTLQAK